MIGQFVVSSNRDHMPWSLHYCLVFWPYIFPREVALVLVVVDAN